MSNTSNSSAITLVFSGVDPKTPLISVNMSGITKLSSSNYLTWKLQVQALLEAHELHVFLDESQTPVATIIVADETAPNPLFVAWKRQDRMLYSALMGTLTVNVQPVVARELTTHEIWQTLANTYGRSSRGHIKQLRQQLKHVTKGDQTVTDYMRNILTKADQLALLGAACDHEDLLDIITDGLGDDFRAIVEMVNGRDSPISVEELHEKLLNRENTLLITNATTLSSVPVTANAAHYPHQQATRGNYRGGYSGGRGNYRNAKPYLGKCQYCGTQGYSARRCPQIASLSSTAPNGGQQQQWTPQAHYTTSSPAEAAPSWLLDSGASHHIASDLQNLALHAPYQGGDDVTVGNGAGLAITHTGSSYLPSQSRSLSLTNVLCVPQMKRNLISVNKLCKTNNVMVQLCPSTFQVKDLSTGATLLNGKASKGVYEWPTTPFSSISAFSCIKSPLSTWHSRLGHPSPPILHHIVSRFALPTTMSSLLCNSCSINKSHKLPFYNTSIVFSKPLEIIFTDVWTAPTYSVDGFKYYVLFVDHFTRYMWLYPIKTKSQVLQIFQAFKALVENRFEQKIKILYSDNGGEYVGLRSYLAANGITHYTTPTHTPEHNGIAERRHMHIVETGMALLTHAQVPIKYWSYAFMTAVYLINRMPTPNLAQASPFRLLFQTEPNYTKLRTFGCLCYPWLRPYGQNKFSPKSRPCVFLGYSLTQSAFLCLDTYTNRVYTSRHVVFHESNFPFSEVSPPSPPTVSSDSSPPLPLSASLAPIYRPPLTHDTPTSSSPSPQTQSMVTESGDIITIPVPVTAETAPVNSHPMTTRAKNNIHKPNSKYGFTAQKIEVVPRTVAQALLDERWRRAMGVEIDNQIREGTWDLVPPNAAYNVLGCKWVFTIKYNADGSVDRFKARLVAKGFHQQPGLDFHETFSPVIKHATVRFVLGVAVAKNWPLRQLDVNHAFLQGHLHDEVYMIQPPGFVYKDKPGYVCRLKKALYGLKQALRAWYNELKQFLLSVGFTTSLGDTSLFTFKTGSNFVYMLIYVDDIIVTGSSTSLVNEVIKTLSTRFALKDHGDLSYFLGLEAHRDKSGLRLTQQRYIINLLKRTKMENSKPVATPMCSSQVLTATLGTPMTDPTLYRATVGSLQYLGLTRPDISFAVNHLSQYMQQPTTVHWEAVKRVLRYLAGTITVGIFFSSSTPMTLHAFSDADWAGNKDDYTSTGAYIVYLGKQPISWASRKQKSVARSTTEAEYRSVADTAAELRWVLSLAKELGVPITGLPTIFCDNIGATQLCSNPVFHTKMKHVALDYHFVREQVQAGLLRVAHVCSADQLADALTKPLPRSKFQNLAVKIGLTNGRPS